MKVLAIADYIENSSQVKENILQHRPDVILTLGDLKREDLEYLKDLSLPKFGIYGNHCDEDYLLPLNIKNLHLKHQTFNNLTWSGFEGCVLYKNAPRQYFQQQATQLLFHTDKADIMLSHAPPAGVNDNILSDSHLGFEAFREYIKNHSPKFWFHGHAYPKKSQKISKLNNTIIIYVHGVEVFDLDEIDINKIPEAKSAST